MLLTGCSSTDEWEVWQIKCVDQYNNVETRRFEGELRPKRGGYYALYPRHVGVEYIPVASCTAKWLGQAGEINND